MFDIGILATKKILVIFLVVLILYYKILSLIFLENITDKENFTSKFKAIKKGKKYLDQCNKGILIKRGIFPLSNIPKISIIIPLYNTGERIKFIIRSIQNQNIADIEILLINDFSNDNNVTLHIIEKLKIEDQRIIIINNKNNMGILYSRCIGVLQSKGEYIMNLDHDDFIFDEDVFDTVYKAAKNGDFDILSFTYITSKDYHLKVRSPRYITLPHNYIVTQPRLSTYPLFKNDRFIYHDFTIWAKLYKNSTYKKAVHLLTYKRYSVFNAYNEDLIGLFTICNVAKNYKYIRKIGVYHYDNSISASHVVKKDTKIFVDIFFTDIILDLAKKQYKKYGAIFLYGRINLSNNNNYNNQYLLKVIDKILLNKFIEEKYKKKIRLKFKKILEKCRLI